MIYLLVVFILIAVIISQCQLDLSVSKVSRRLTDEYSNYFSWNGIKVHYKDEGNGIPILFLHGTSSSLHTWDKLTGLLKENHRILRLDLVGFGISGSHPERDYSIKMYLDFINDFRNFIGVDKFIIAGNSWGGMLAWNFSAIYPQQVLGLILINSAGFKMNKVPLRFRLVQNSIGRWLIKNSTPKWMVKKGLREVLYSKTVNKKLVERYRTLTLRKGNRQAFIDFILNRLESEPKLLPHILTPTLILWGRHDKLYPLEQAYLFKNQITNAQLIIIEKSAHIPMEENPLICGLQIKKFTNSIQISLSCV